MRKLNKESLELIKKWEGLKLTAYPDPGSRDGNPWTIGYGHTSDNYFKVYKGLKITEDKAEDLLVHDLEEAIKAVERLVKVDLTDNQFGVLVSFVHNLGVGAFAKSTLLKKLNKKDYDSIPAELAKWVNNDGKKMKGLVNRRAAEAGLWAKGEFVSSSNVSVEAAKPPAITQETVSWGAGILSTIATAFSGGINGNWGPIQIAFAVIMVLAFSVGVYLFISKRVVNK